MDVARNRSSLQYGREFILPGRLAWWTGQGWAKYATATAPQRVDNSVHIKPPPAPVPEERSIRLPRQSRDRPQGAEQQPQERQRRSSNPLTTTSVSHLLRVVHSSRRTISLLHCPPHSRQHPIVSTNRPRTADDSETMRMQRQLQVRS